jgi:glutamate-1-semialdehyde 2,1-aminomutase
MKHANHEKVLRTLAAEYERHSPRSAAANREALKYLVDGGSHTIRLIRPFPPRIASASGAYVTDEDGHRILDFWQGHYANILGHNPAELTGPLSRAFASGFGLQTGFTDRLQIEVAELACRLTGSERVRFTSSGSLATMYAVLLARGFTGRELVMKVGGGWHGAQPWGLVGVDLREGDHASYQHAESKGLPGAVAQEVICARYNDTAMLERIFTEHGSRVACFILEPVIGSGGFLPGDPAYLAAARALTAKHGSLLIFDEVIAGFRFRAGAASALYGVRPDLATFAKVMGGGMPVAAVAGRADVMALAGRGGGVKFSGGTYSCHPASMLAAKTMMGHLAAHEVEIYPRINALGETARRTVEAALRAEGFAARCTGDPGPALGGSSVGAVAFPYNGSADITSPEQVRDPETCDVELADMVLQLALLLEDVHVVHGLGCLTVAHTEAHVERLGEACRAAAHRIRAAGQA